jgi:hypothetical protein
MKNIIGIISLGLLALLSTPTAQAQKRTNLGLGYFGETLTHPGIVAHLEVEKKQSERVATLLGTNLSVYLHRRNHLGILLDGHTGLRRYYKSGFFTEQYLGLGVMLSFYQGDGVFQRDENGNIRRVSSFANPDIIPSVTLGLGYNLGHRQQKATLLYLRPKIYWQIPFNNLALPHLGLQAGCMVSLH